MDSDRHKHGRDTYSIRRDKRTESRSNRNYSSRVIFPCVLQCVVERCSPLIENRVHSRPKAEPDVKRGIMQVARCVASSGHPFGSGVIGSMAHTRQHNFSGSLGQNISTRVPASGVASAWSVCTPRNKHNEQGRRGGRCDIFNSVLY